jgi:hypothetical protein
VVLIEDEGTLYQIGFEQIESARLVPEF